VGGAAPRAPATAGDARGPVTVGPAAARRGARVGDLSAPQAVSLAVGPEGGWTAEEAERAVVAGWQPLTLGGRVLRAEAAPLAALAACQAVWLDT